MNESLPAATLRLSAFDENGSLMAFWLTPWLHETIKAHDAQVGDLIALTFLGKRESRRGQRYNAYSLLVEKAEGHAPE
jgi:hypothetical protein